MYKHEIPSPIPNPRLPPGCTDSDFTHLYANKVLHLPSKVKTIAYGNFSVT